MHFRARIIHSLQLISILALLVLVCWLTSRSPMTRDVTRARAHTLSQASVAVLSTLTTPVAITAYLPGDHPFRKQIDHLVDRYRRHQPSLTLDYVDPESVPELVRSREIRTGELIMETDGRIERTAHYSEQAVTEALARLARATERWIVFVKGHGERSSSRGANHDLSEWVETLEKRGLNVQEISLAEFDVVPDNTTVLVIASPQVDYQARESKAVVEYLARGGNLLWLAEPDSPPGLVELEREVGFERIPGTIVDPLTIANGIENPAFILLDNYAAHPATDGFNYTTVLFYATGLHERAADGWQAHRLILSSDKAWSETQALSGNVGYEAASDYLGPLPVALALSRRRDEHEQRVIVIGDGDFLTNAYLQNSGNQDLGVRLIEWLSRDDLMIGVASRAAIDNKLTLQDWHKAVMGFGFLIVLPMAFALNGLLIWWRRRRA
ncbi:MAG: ABC-type uncharacterized transport system involved in gliding motility auxiliary subunit [Gammaproteobacteria bacterium]|jgi:ABC-type uncharacterized transport system involved in gliding motility auxiliary subunit